ncbi:arylsulfatase [Chachezhania sediminis]|uniref:arylsulfatase n=1 Tax=Chachezhania sediminis TaxID=2599291 RepID=UPI001E58BD29|nr:arylsulfatase [Chachezhania sediminis]
MTGFLSNRSAACFMLGAATLALGQPVEAQEGRPNIVLIVADDMGYSDIGAFGGEIPTPSLDALAREGTRFTNFHVAPTCSPSRAMLMSGTDNHVAGLGTMAEEILDEQRGLPGYEGFLNDRVVSFPQVLRDNGYHTYMSGKWHLGGREEQRPAARGFERSFALINGAAHHFDQTGAIEALPKATYTRDGELVDLGEDFTYSTEYFTTHLIDQIEAATDNAPFFAFLGFSAPHWPLQAPDDSIALFEGKYDGGYDEIRGARLERMREIGLIGPDVQPNLEPDLWPHWNELDAEQRKIEARKMEVYAAMIYEIDQNVGRLVTYLKEKGEYDDTVFIFFSDNGAEGTLPGEVLGGRNREYISRAFDNSLENLGRRGSYFGYGPSWAAVSQTPFRMTKGFTYEGGTRSPAFISYPGWGAGGRQDHFVHITDIAPTLLDIAGVTEIDTPDLKPMTGHSLMPWLQGVQDVPRPQQDPVCTELFGRVAVWKDGWKIVHSNAPWGAGDFELFDLGNDPVERQDLAAERKDKLAELKADWEHCRAAYDIYWYTGLSQKIVATNQTQYLFEPPHTTSEK